MSDKLYAIGSQGLEVTLPNVGVHFGTVWRDNVEAGPVTMDDVLASWEQPLQLYALDRFLRVFDRDVHGNALVEQFNGKKRLIAADQSDCFGGVNTILKGSDAIRASRAEARFAVVDSDNKVVPFEAVLRKSGMPWSRIVNGMEGYWPKLATAANVAASECPGAWAEVTRVDPTELSEYLKERSRSMTTLLNPTLVEPPREALDGGILIKPPEDKN